MRNIIYVYLLALVPLFFFSCNPTESDIECEKIFELHFGESKNTPFYLSQMIDTVSYIELDSSVAIGNIDEIVYSNDTIFLCDKQFGKIYVHDLEGNSVNVFDRRGRASNEYINIHDFDIDPITKNIHIYDGARHSFLVYSKDGEHLKTIRVSDIVRDFKMLKNGEYLIYTPDYNKGSMRGLWKIDSNGRFLEQLLTISVDFRYGGLYPQYLHRIDDNTIGLMSGEDNDAIYHITSDTIIGRYALDLGISIPKSLQKEKLLDFNKHKGVVYTKSDYYESKKWMSFSASNFNSILMYFYDKVNNKAYCITREEDIIEDVEVYGNFRFSDMNIGINLLYPHTILSNPDLTKRFPKITMESNPILVYVTLK